MADYSEIERMVKSVLYSSGVVFYQDANTLKFNGDAIYTPDSATGQTGTRGPQGTHGEKGDKGEKGDIGPRGPKGDSGGVIIPDIRCTVSIDNNTSTENPTCTVTKTGSSASPIFNFTFAGLKGIDGKDGKDGENGKDGKDGENGINGVDADNEQVLRLIATVENKVNQQKTRIDNFLSSIDNKVKNQILSIVGTSEWWQQNFPSGSGSQSNFGQNDVKEYLQTLGLWFENDNATYTKWSTIKQEVGSLRAEVNQMKQSGNNMESLAGELYTYLTGDTITSGLQSTWSKFLKLGENNIEMLEWITSGVRSQANSREGVAQLFASAQGQSQNAYAGIDARVRAIEGSYVSTANINTKVKNSLNSLIMESTDSNSLSSLVSSINDKITGVASEVDDKIGTAVSTLFSENEEVKASISTIVSENVSRVKIKADQIDLQGQTWADVINLDTNDLFSSDSIVINPSEIQVIGTSTKSGYNAIINESGIEFNASSTWGSNTSNIGITGFTFPGLSYVTTHPVLGYGNLTITNGNIVAGEEAKIKTSVLTTDDDLLIESEDDNSSITIHANDIYFTADNSIVASPSISNSDENLKNIISNIEVPIEDIASTRIINYEFKKNPGKINVGTIAQDWQNIVPNAVKVIDKEQHLGIDYSSISIVSAVTAAREIVKLKQENEQLKQRLALIEEKLSKIQ